MSEGCFRCGGPHLGTGNPMPCLNRTITRLDKLEREFHSSRIVKQKSAEQPTKKERYAKLRSLIDEWSKDESGYDERVYPIIEKALHKQNPDRDLLVKIIEKAIDAPAEAYRRLGQRIADAIFSAFGTMKPDDPPVCRLSGPGHGDCEHFIGLDVPRDEYGKPNGWCWFCWMSYQLKEVSEVPTLDAMWDAYCRGYQEAHPNQGPSACSLASEPGPQASMKAIRELFLHCEVVQNVADK